MSDLTTRLRSYNRDIFNEAADEIERLSAELAAIKAQPQDPMDWPIPCDVTVGAGTIRKGCKFSTVIARMQTLHGMATRATLAQKGSTE